MFSINNTKTSKYDTVLVLVIVIKLGTRVSKKSKTVV